LAKAKTPITTKYYKGICKGKPKDKGKNKGRGKQKGKGLHF
jgi:hypothetical protein